MLVDAEGGIMACERTPEQGDCRLGDLGSGGIDPEKAHRLLQGIAGFFSRRCPDCLFCRLCMGCAAEFTDTQGRLSEEAMETFCRRSFQELSRMLPQWAHLHERNPACFDYMECLAV